MEFSAAELETIEQLKILFHDVKSPQKEVQDEVYAAYQHIIHETPNLCMLLLAILIDESIEPDIRIVAASSLRRNYTTFPEEIMHQFIESAFHFFETAIHDGGSPILKQIESLYVEYVIAFGDHYYENIPNLIEWLLASEDTASIGLQCLYELVNHKNYPEIDLCNQLLIFISDPYSSTELSTYALNIFHRLLILNPEVYLEFVFDNVLPIIDQQIDSLPPNGLPEAITILAILFYHTENESLGDAIGQLVASQEEGEIWDALEFLVDANGKIPFNETLFTSLFMRLGEETESTNQFDYSLCDISHELIQSMCASSKEEATPVMINLLTECENDTQIMRALYAWGDGENASQIIPDVMQRLSDENRGDAALCLTNICAASPPLSAEAIELLLPMLSDEDGSVRDKVYFVIEDLMQNISEPSPNWFQSLASAYIANVDEMHHIARILVIYLSFDFQIELADFFRDVLARFFEPPSSLCLRYDAIILSAVVTKSNIEFCSEIIDIINYSSSLLNNEDLLAEQSAPETIEGLCGLIRALLDKFGPQIIESECLCDFIRSLSTALRHDVTFTSKDDSLGVLSTVLSLKAEIVGNCLPSLAESMALTVPHDNDRALPGVVAFWRPFVPSAPAEVIGPLASGFAALFKARLPMLEGETEVFSFFGEIVEAARERGISSEEVEQTYAESCSVFYQ